MDKSSPANAATPVTALDPDVAPLNSGGPSLRQHALLACGLLLLFALPATLLIALPEARLFAPWPDGFVVAGFTWVALALTSVFAYRVWVRAGVHQQRLLGQMREAEDQYRFLFERNPLPAYVFHRDSHHILAANDALLREYGYNRTELIGTDAIKFLAEEQRALALAATHAWSDEMRRTHVWKHVNRAGTAFDVLTYGSDIEFQGQPARLVVVQNISERLRNETDLRLLRRAMASANNGVLVACNGERDMPVAYVNPAFVQISRVCESELLGRALDRVKIGTGGWCQALKFIGEALARRREGRSLTRLNDDLNGERWLEVHVAPVRDAEGITTHFLSVVSDVTDRERAQEALAHRATHDELTGLPNRRLIVERIDSLLESLPPACALSVLFIDLDHFKLINDTLGHAAGDRFLQIVSERLMAAVPDADIVGRFGGDEFVVVIHDHDDGRAASDASARILETLTRPLESKSRLHYLTPSIGYAIAPRGGRDADVLLKQADMAMYEAKRRGRNSAVAWHPNFETVVTERLHLVSRLRDALTRGEFELHFQLQFEVESGAPAGIEALLRWRHPQRGLLTPTTFVNVAEESGLIMPIGEWALREAARSHVRLVDAGWPELPIAVNVSAAQFLRGELLDDVTLLIKEFALPPLALELELTESVVLEDPKAAIAAMQKLRALGVAITIDDFGIGYSSLSYLRELPADKLKLDRSFVADLEREPKATAICALIIRLAQSLGLRVVAEGVETREQLEWLQRQGCDQVQGYLLGPPMPFEALLTQLATAPRNSRSAVA